MAEYSDSYKSLSLIISSIQYLDKACPPSEPWEIKTIANREYINPILANKLMDIGFEDISASINEKNNLIEFLKDSEKYSNIWEYYCTITERNLNKLKLCNPELSTSLSPTSSYFTIKFDEDDYKLVIQLTIMSIATI